MKSIRSVLPLLLLVLVSVSSFAQAQTREVTGRVTTTAGQPLSGVVVALAGQTGGVRTNERGEFRLQVPNGDVTVIARTIGYKRGTQRVPSTTSSVEFSLEKDVLELEGVVVTGAATSIERRNAATAVAVVSADALARVPAQSLESALQGKVIGASINMNNGAPGGGGQIQIRGASSLIGRIDPLIIVDGVAISNATRSNMQSSITGSLNAAEENGTNRLADINPNDIANVEVLKSAAASAIYGSQATNGVVIITTKRGREGSPRLNFTQRVGTSGLIRKQGSRHFANLADALAEIGANNEGIAAANAACTASSCPYFDYQGDLYGRKKPSYESVMSLSGGVGSTRYYASGSDKQEAGIAMNTGARRQSLRANIDQNVGDRITINLGSNLLRSFSQRGVSNNDNAFSSPLYGFAYTPAIIDLQQKDALGQYVLNPFAGGGTLKGSNPFQTFDLMQNNEDVYRLIFSGRANWAAFTGEKNSLNFSVQGGADRYSNENYIRAPQELQFQRAGTTEGGTFPGAIVQGNGTERLTNVTTSAVWAFTPGWISATTSAGVQLQDRAFNDYNLLGRGLGPQQSVAAGAQNITITDRQEKSRTQAAYGQEELLLFGERLYVAGAIRGERASLNGDPRKTYYYPRASASYRFNPSVRGVDELKLRTSLGVSGNQPSYGDRFLALTSYGIIGGLPAYGLPATIGNPTIKPERLNEFELGLDGAFLNQRMRMEATYYNRSLTDLLVRPQLAPSTGINATVVNGGEMTTKGYEMGLTLIPIQRNNLSWTSRTTWYQSRADITSFPPGVQPFTTGTAAGGFGNAYGRLRFAPGHTVTTIWGNKIVNGATVGNQPLADANPKYLMSFGNDVSFGSLNFNVLVDYRRGGTVSNMTLNLFDEGANTWDYDEPSPDPTVGATLGAYRYNTWGGGANTAAYLVDGSYTKVREVNLSYDLPSSFAARFRGAQSAKISFSGRNLFIISGYNGFDPEVNNGGNFVARFVDLSPFPPSRSFWLSFDLGF
ncbi:MAG TPA: SusC/RagA family TonB-linked outer membrane protein [Gemmatimonadaceae bacterium]|nr:SusC/RagA family TonB-linked outer membrane protein [Gemmatimonadaceae bacterium]